MSIDLDYLESLAKAATQGPWVTDPRNCDIVIAYAGDVAEAQRISNAGNDAYYIAAANPAVLLELIAELRAKNKLLEEIFDDCGDKNNGTCPVCSTYTHLKWCWYPHLAKMLGKPLDKYDERFLAEEKKWKF